MAWTNQYAAGKQTNAILCRRAIVDEYRSTGWSKKDDICVSGTLLRYIAFMRNVFCFNGFNQALIVIRYSAHIKPRKRLKPLNQTTFTHNHNMTLIVSSQSIAVNK